uniref:Ig-like domain-containing protein n=1 Tax=Biomphalaria glabrata TaxID=6526 RepID=A0A2C9M2U4_BIOGL
MYLNSWKRLISFLIIIAVFLIYSSLCLDENIQICNGHTRVRTLVLPLYSLATVSFCVLSPLPLEDVYFLNSKVKQLGNSEDGDVYVASKLVDHQSQYNITLNVRNITLANYMVYTVLLHDNSSHQLKLEVTFKRPGIHFTKDRTDGNVYENQHIKLLCERNSEFQETLSLFRMFDRKVLNTFKDKDKLVYEIASTKCQDMGRYTCETKHDKKFLDLEIFNCPPVACFDNMTSVYTSDVGLSTTIQFCVVAFPGLLNVVQLDGQDYALGSRYPNVAFHLTNEGLYHVINITITNVTADDLRVHYVSVATKHGRHNHTFKLQRTEPLRLLFINKRSLQCVSSQYPKSVTLYKYDQDQALMSKSDNAATEESLTLTHHLSSRDCNDIGTYLCVSGNFIDQKTSKTVDFRSGECPPIPCFNYNKKPELETHVNKSLVFHYCVIDQEGLLDRVLVNGTTVLADVMLWNREVNVLLLLKKMEMYHYLTFLFPHIQKSMFGVWNVTITSNSTRTLELFLHIIEKQDGNTNSYSTTVLAITITLAILLALVIGFGVWFNFFKGTSRSFKILQSSTTSSRITLDKL